MRKQKITYVDDIIADLEFGDYIDNESSSISSDGGESNSFVKVRSILEDHFSFVAIVASHSISNAQHINTLNFLHSADC